MTVVWGRRPKAANGLRSKRLSVRRSNAATDGVRGRPAVVEVVESLEDLMTAVARGDEAAFARLYDEVSGAVYGIALRVLDHAAAAEAVAEEALLDIWRTAARFDRDQGCASTYIMTLVHQRAVDLLRHQESGRARQQRQAEPPEAPVDAAASAVDGSCARHSVQQRLGALTPLQRHAVKLAYFDGYTSSEVAALLGVNPSTANTHLRDGLLKLRRQMDHAPTGTVAQ